MAFEPVPLQSLERGYLRVLRIRSALGWLIALAVATAVEAVLYWQANMLPGVVAGPVGVLGVISTIFFVPRRWRHWSVVMGLRRRAGGAVHRPRGRCL